MELKTNKILLEPNNYKHIFIFGDSHCLCFGQGKTNVNNKYYINMLKQDSASARGLISIDSTLKYGKTIEEFIKFKKWYSNTPFNSNEINNYYVFKFGQVDIEYNYYYKLIIKEEKITKNDFFNDVIDKYIQYIRQLNKLNIIVCGVNLPSPINMKKYKYNILKLNNKNTIIENLTIEEINKDSIIFNQLLKQKCDINNIKYFDLIEECTYTNNNEYYLRKEFIGTDHHYKGCRSLNALKYEMKNDHNDDYINYILFKKTYYTFINKLINNIETK